MKAVFAASGSNHSGSSGNRRSNPSTDLAAMAAPCAPGPYGQATQWMMGACQPADAAPFQARRKEENLHTTVITAFGRADITSSTSLSARRDERVRGKRSTKPENCQLFHIGRADKSLIAHRRAANADPFLRTITPFTALIRLAASLSPDGSPARMNIGALKLLPSGQDREQVPTASLALKPALRLLPRVRLRVRHWRRRDAESLLRQREYQAVYPDPTSGA